LAVHSIKPQPDFSLEAPIATVMNFFTYALVKAQRFEGLNVND